MTCSAEVYTIPVPPLASHLLTVSALSSINISFFVNSDLTSCFSLAFLKLIRGLPPSKSELTKNDILIDDRADTIGRWEANGGTGIVYNSADQVINDLKKLNFLNAQRLFSEILFLILTHFS